MSTMRNMLSPQGGHHSRMMGLGQKPGSAPVSDVVKQTIGCGFTQVPVIEYVTWTVDLPVADAAVTATFGDEIDVLQNPKTVNGVTDVDSSFVINGLLQVDMLVVGFGVHAFAEPQNGTQIGNYVNPAPAPGSVPVSPDSFTTNDITGSPNPLGLAADTTITPAELEWGVCAQNAIWHMMNGYQFQWIMQQRYLLINELAADVAYFGSYAEAVGAGSSSQAFQRYVNRVNTRYASLGAPGAFVPINAQRVGSVGTAPNVGVFHPTRAYDQLDVTYGGLRVQGMTGAINPFRRLFRPVLLEKGIPIGMLLRSQDNYHVTQMQKYLAQSDLLGGTVTTMPIGAGVSGTTVAPAGVIFNELTFPDTATPTTSLVSQQVQTDRVLLKGGAMQLAILIKGFEIWGPWKQYIQQQLVPGGFVSVPGPNQAL